ncbi:Rv3235 family protein [Arthrobacter tecti]
MSMIAHLSPAAAYGALASASGAPRPVLPRSAHTGPRDDASVVVPLTRPSEPAPSPEPEIPEELEAVARKVARGALEVLGGTRPLQQMARLLDARSYERLQLRANLVRSVEQSNDQIGKGSSSANTVRLHRNVMIRTVRICAISETIFEASVVAAEQRRARAIALRIERWRGQWRVTEMQIG